MLMSGLAVLNNTCQFGYQFEGLPGLEAQEPVQKREKAEREIIPEILNESIILGPPKASEKDVHKNRVNELSTAMTWIERFKSQGLEKYDIEDTAAKIMAVRLLADAGKGDKDSLKTRRLDERQIDAMVEKIKEADGFEAFVKANSEFIRGKLGDARFHGGSLDKAYTKYLTTRVEPVPNGLLKPGETQPDPDRRKILERYMPKAKDRIKALQAMRGKDGAYISRSQICAEILAIRRNVNAARKSWKGSALDVKINVAKDGEESIAQQREKLSDDKIFRRVPK